MPKVFLASDSQFTEILKIWPGCVGDAFQSELYPWMVNNAEVFLLLFIVNDEVDFCPGDFVAVCRNLLIINQWHRLSCRTSGENISICETIVLNCEERDSEIIYVLLHRLAKRWRRGIFSSMFSACSKPESYKLDIQPLFLKYWVSDMDKGTPSPILVL
jgi:hypothetical protein